MKTRRHLILNMRVGCLLFIFTLSLSLFPLSTLEIKRKEGGPIYLRRISPGDQFEFLYFHSVDKTPVIGYFLVTPNKKIKLIETRFQSYGPGLPSTERRPPQREGKDLIVKTEEIELDCFSFFVSPMTQQTINLKGDRIDFSNFKEGETIIVRIAFRPLFLEVILNYGNRS
ncbi:MAG: DUF1850 domain-containing protein [Thermodesulfobacteriota bacterium]